MEKKFLVVGDDSFICLKAQVEQYVKKRMESEELRREVLSVDDVTILYNMFNGSGSVVTVANEADLQLFLDKHEKRDYYELVIGGYEDVEDSIKAGTNLYFMVNRFINEKIGGLSRFCTYELVYKGIYEMLEALFVYEKENPGSLEASVNEVYGYISNITFAIEGCLKGIYYLITVG